MGSGGPLADPSFANPGLGERCHHDCGSVVGAEACPHAQNDPGNHDKRYYWRTYDNRECPTCYEDWRTKRADAIGDRIAGGLRAYQRDRTVKALGTSRHVVFSPPQDQWGRYHTPANPADGYDQFFTDAQAMASKAGLNGGVTLLHLGRIPDTLKTRLEEKGYGDGSGEGGYHDGARADALNLGSWRSYYLEGPHAHIIAPGWMTNSREFHAETGWTYKTLSKATAEKGRTVKEVVRDIARYLLSHTAILAGNPRKHAYRFWGAFSYNKLRKEGETVVSVEPVVCEGCGGPVFEYLVTQDGAIDWSYQQQPTTRREVHGKYVLVDRPPPEGSG